MKILHFNFLPRSADLGLLVLRVWFGLAMLTLHGWGKVTGFGDRAAKFSDPFGIGGPATLSLVIFAEVICAVLLVAGAFTRFAALVLGITMSFAFWMAHGHRLTGQGNGELPFLFLAVLVVLFVSGAGKFSVDARLGARS